VPPSGFAAGMWSKIDARRGVWKAPAGVETGLLGVAGLQYVVENGEQDVLNPLGVNALRALPGFGRVIWGARTLSTRADPEWRYVPVRRTAIMIEQSIYEGIQWAVFEPNDHRLWASLRTNIDAFMNGLFRSGAFQGEKASDAYFVRCRLGDTMTQDDIDAGRVIVIVGFAPLKPAEFVIVRIQQKVGQQ
jgi:phage tail sheath protein FI